MKKLATGILASFAAMQLVMAADSDTNAPPSGTTADNTNSPVVAAEVTPADNSTTNGLRLNFKDVPISTVLDYLSEKAGYIVMSDVAPRGNITLESAQPMSREEILDTLNMALKKNGYTAVARGRYLSILGTSDAQKAADTKIFSGADPTNIPPTDTIATWILPVHSLNPAQLAKDLEPLKPSDAVLTPNEAGNALIMTAPQSVIHRFAEIIKALDSSSVSDIAVFVLQYADAKSVATELKEIFQSADSSVARAQSFQRGGGGQRFRGFGGGGGGFPFGGGGGGGGGGDNAEDKNSASVVVTSDDQMNAVILSAPTELMRAATNVINQLDQPVEDVTIVRVFHLKHADPTETSTLLSGLFPDDSTTSQNGGRGGFPFFARFGGAGGFGGGGAAANQSDRMKRQSKVISVPDARTQSIIVTTSKNLMGEIEQVIASLDADPSGAQKVIALDISNADASQVQQLMSQLFPSLNGRTQATSTTSDALATRQQNAATQQQTSTSTTSFGGGGGGTTGLR